MARFGDGLGLGPDLDSAAGSALEQALAPLDGPPDLLCLFICDDDEEAVATVAARAMAAAGDAVTIGCSATGVIGGRRGVEHGSAVSAFAAVLPGARRTPFRLTAERATDRLLVAGLPDRLDDDAAAILLADPYSFPVDAFVQRTADILDGLPIVGGLANAPGGRGRVRLFLDGDVHDGGAVGIVLGGSVNVATIVSQGCRPIGPAMTVTAARDNMVFELAGTPALVKLEQIVAALPVEEQRLAMQGLQIGVAMDEYAHQHDHGDFLIRGVVGADRETGALVVGDVLELGQTVRFQVRDPAAAQAELEAVLAGFGALSGIDPVEGALLVSCNGRGAAFFPDADHDVAAVRRGLGAQGIGGFFAAGEIGPVGGRNHVHGFTASILAFGPQEPIGDGDGADDLAGRSAGGE